MEKYLPSSKLFLADWFPCTIPNCGRQQYSPRPTTARSTCSHFSEQGGNFATAGLPSLPRGALFVLTHSKENLNAKSDDARG